MNRILRQKKRYAKPELKAIALDREISLMMASDPGGGVTPPFPSAPSPSPGFKGPQIISQDDVFGGKTPFPTE